MLCLTIYYCLEEVRIIMIVSACFNIHFIKYSPDKDRQHDEFYAETVKLILCQ